MSFFTPYSTKWEEIAYLYFSKSVIYLVTFLSHNKSPRILLYWISQSVIIFVLNYQKHSKYKFEKKQKPFLKRSSHHLQPIVNFLAFPAELVKTPWIYKHYLMVKFYIKWSCLTLPSISESARQPCMFLLWSSSHLMRL